MSRPSGANVTSGMLARRSVCGSERTKCRETGSVLTEDFRSMTVAETKAGSTVASHHPSMEIVRCALPIPTASATRTGPCRLTPQQRSRSSNFARWRIAGFWIGQLGIDDDVRRIGNQFVVSDRGECAGTEPLRADREHQIVRHAAKENGLGDLGVNRQGAAEMHDRRILSAMGRRATDRRHRYARNRRLDHCRRRP